MKTINDPTACIVFGVFEKDKRKHILILDAWSEHLEYPDLRTKVIADWQAKYGGRKRHKLDDPMHPPHRVDVVLIEEKGSGVSLIQDLRRANIGARTWNPGRADKVSRAIQATPLLECGSSWVLESSLEKGKPITWVRPMLHELSLFPVSDRDDYTDCWSQAYIYFRDVGLMALPEAPHEYQEDRDYYRERQQIQNPYLA